MDEHIHATQICVGRSVGPEQVILYSPTSYTIACISFSHQEFFTINSSIVNGLSFTECLIHNCPCFWANLGLVQSPIELEVLCFDASLCSFLSAASCKWCISLWVLCLCSFKVPLHANLFPHTRTLHLPHRRTKISNELHFRPIRYSQKGYIL